MKVLYKYHDSKVTYIETKLTSFLKNPVSIIITDNTRSIIYSKWEKRVYRIRLHHMFLDADESTLKALAYYISGKRKDTHERLDDFIRKHKWKIRRTPESSRPRKIPLRVQGQYFNLANAFNELNQTYFNNQIKCSIMWGNAPRRVRQRSVRLGSYSYRTSTIRINPLLDRPFVPQYVLDSIVYHEMLHHLLGSKEKNGRQMSHHRTFKHMEKRFVHYNQAKQWIDKNLTRLLKERRMA